MKSNEILKAIGIPQKGNSEVGRHYATIHKLLVEVKDDIVSGELIQGSERDFDRDINNEIIIQMDLKVTTKNGCYKFPVPIDNAYFYSLCDLVGLPCKNTRVEITEFIMGVIVVPEILDDIKKASKYISKDYLIPQMQCVCLDFDGESVQVVATDSHMLYLGQKRGYERNDKTPFKILITSESVKELSSVKVDYESPLTIKVVDKETAYFDDIKVELFEENYCKYPDYKAVVHNTESLHPICFNSNGFVKAVKQMIPSAMCKYMPIVTILSNGADAYKNQLHISAESLDFDTDAYTRLNCNCESSFDMEVSFNGKLLAESLAIFKGQDIQMFAANERVFSFTNGIDTVLVSPCSHKPIIINAPKKAAKIETSPTMYITSKGELKTKQNNFVTRLRKVAA